VGWTGDIVGVTAGTAVASGKGASVESCAGGAVIGDSVCADCGTTGASDGAVERIGASVGDCAKGARLQTSLPPITSTGVMSEHCWAF
jgi:hypothetical protein